MINKITGLLKAARRYHLDLNSKETQDIEVRLKRKQDDNKSVT